MAHNAACGIYFHVRIFLPSCLPFSHMVSFSLKIFLKKSYSEDYRKNPPPLYIYIYIYIYIWFRLQYPLISLLGFFQHVFIKVFSSEFNKELFFILFKISASSFIIQDHPSYYLSKIFSIFKEFFSIILSNGLSLTP